MKQAKDYIVFPLDVASFEEAKRFTQLLSGRVGMFKVGLELFTRYGPDIVRMVKEEGNAGVFLDLKLHDIPVTVLRAMASISDLEVDLTTVHCGESTDTLKAAVEGSKGKTGVLGVTLLTSISGEDLRVAGYREDYADATLELVLKKAAMANATGCKGVVCSGLEVEGIKQTFGENFLCVTPGIRLTATTVGREDQQRITTPARAVEKGADFLVIGRPIRDAQDPVATVSAICEEIEKIL